jgi:hypothetical protein
MRINTTSGLKSSVCAGFAVTLTALIACAFDLYTPYIRESTTATASSEQVFAITSAIRREARDA